LLYSRRQEPSDQVIARAGSARIGSGGRRIRPDVRARTVASNFHRRQRSMRVNRRLRPRAPGATVHPGRARTSKRIAPSIRRLALPRRTDARALRSWPVLSLAAVVLLAPLAAAADMRPRTPELPKPGAHDALAALIRRMDRYLHRNAVDGVTMDWRY